MRRILLIEDDAVFRDHVARALGRAGFEVSLAPDGESGWAAVDASPPELVLLDLALPRLPGLALLRRLRSDPRHRGTPVLVVSAHTDKAADAVMNGAQGYLIKGRFTMTQLIETVRRMLVAASRRSDADPLCG
jgi:two-component system chemotaxis response regulator CheY